jgi:hypothetical protein
MPTISGWDSNGRLLYTEQSSVSINSCHHTDDLITEGESTAADVNTRERHRPNGTVLVFRDGHDFAPKNVVLDGFIGTHDCWV